MLIQQTPHGHGNRFGFVSGSQLLGRLFDQGDDVGSIDGDNVYHVTPFIPLDHYIINDLRGKFKDERVAADLAGLIRSLRVLLSGRLEMTQAGNITVDATLDATGLLCPLPVLKARRALKPLAPGAVLEVIATDPGAAKDFEHFCQTTGCELLEASEQPGGVLRFRLKKPG